MTSPTIHQSSPFTRAVVNSMRKLYPEALADKSFDNTGLLLEAPFYPSRRQNNSVLLTIDLTQAVAEEAIERKDSVVVAYHPIIFRGLKSLTLSDPQQQSLLRLALEGISVYSPHTAVDAAPGGVNDWLCDIVTGKLSEPEPETKTANVSGASSTAFQSASSQLDDPFTEESPEPPSENQQPIKRNYSRPTYPIAPAEWDQTDLHPSSADHTRCVIQPAAEIEGFEGAGYGRIVTFTDPQPLTHLIERVARGVGTPKGFPVAIPQNKQVEDMSIKTVGICAGSGGSILRDLDVDLLFTGELSHHEALAATEKGQAVITLFHSNTERGFLNSVLREQLESELREQWQDVREEEEGNEEWDEALNDGDVSVEVSERDRDPYGIVVLQDCIHDEEKKK
ncbi:MAG: hypothetical protein M1834_001410 [Cirrosporium novae-zelandiae]|nr:MAG: hypothetical protein M1834_001410 [Cirrosporium novae-zelandiae]